MADEVKGAMSPALTAEEWAAGKVEAKAAGATRTRNVHRDQHHESLLPPRKPQRVTILCRAPRRNSTT